MTEALPVGTVISDRYTLGAPLTLTAHEGIYRATAPWGGRVILTMFRPPHAETPTGARTRQAFLRSARLLAQVQHPGVLRVTDLIEAPDQVVVAQEDRLGQALHERLQEGAWAPAEVEWLTRLLFGTLAAAHAQALLHTQLTPAHVWFDPQGHPLLSGFGLARRALQEVGAVPPPDARYAAPEVLAGAPPSPQADVYALGAVLLEAATGQAPPPTGARQQGVPLPLLPPGTRPGVRAALAQALQLDPAERAVSAAEVLESMDRAGEEPAEPPAPVEEPAPSAPPAPPRPAGIPTPPPPAPRRAFPLWPAVGLLGALALGGAWAAFRLPGASTTQDNGETSLAAAPTPSTPAEAAPAPVPEPEPVGLRTDVVTAANLNLREAPTGTVLTTLARGAVLDVLAEQGGWLQVRTATGQQGWVSDQHTLPRLGEELVQALLDQLAQGGNITLERGVYWFGEPVQVTADTHLVGAGQKATLLMSDAPEDTLILQGVDASLTGLSVIHTGSQPARVVLQEGGTLTAERVTLAGAVQDADQELYGSGLWVKGAGQAQLQQVTFSGNAFGLSASDDSHTEVGHATFSGNSEGGVLFRDDATGTVRNSTIAENGAHGVRVLGEATPEFVGNRIRRNRGRGLTIYGEARPTIVDNTIEENRLQGIGVQDEAQPRLLRNTIQGNRQSGLTFFDNAGGTVEGNILQANWKAGLAVTEYASPTLSGNTLRQNRENGLSYADHSSGVARDNVVSGNGNPGIAVWGDAQPNLLANTVLSNKQSGIVLAERASGEVRGNTVSSNGLYGLIVTGSATPVVAENTVTENAQGGIFYKQQAGGSGYGNQCYGNGGPDLSAALDSEQPGPDFSMDGCRLE